MTKAVEDRWRKHYRTGEVQIGPTGIEQSYQRQAPEILEPKLPEPLGPEDQMNGLEASFARDVLRPQEVMGEIRDWCYEPLRFVLSHAIKGKRRATTYTPDFLAISKKFTIYEIKGHMEDDAAVKIKVAAELFPWFEWVLVTRKKGEWVFKGV